MAKSNNPIRIALLADHQQFLPLLQDWFEAEWQPYYGPDGEGDAEQDLQECCRSDGLPLALVALDQDGNRWEPWLCGIVQSARSRARDLGWLPCWLHRKSDGRG